VIGLPVSRVPVVFGGVVELLRPYSSFILPAVFLGFFVAAAVAIGFYGRWRVRHAFVTCFFVALLLFNFVVPMAPLPFMSWGHFAEPTTETETYFEFRLVDESGREVKMDSRLTIEFDTISTGSLRRSMRTEYGDEKNEAISRYLLSQASVYRSQVGEQPLHERVRYPSHSMTSVWTPELLEAYDSFIGIRIYNMTFVTSGDGTDLVRYEEAVVYEAFPDGRQPAGDPPSAMPTRSMNRTVLDASSGNQTAGVGA